MKLNLAVCKKVELMNNKIFILKTTPLILPVKSLWTVVAAAVAWAWLVVEEQQQLVEQKLACEEEVGTWAWLVAVVAVVLGLEVVAQQPA